MPAVCAREHLDKARRLRKLLAAYTAAEDLIKVGAYQKGLDPVLDRAVAALPAITGFLQQSSDEPAPFDRTQAALAALPG
jgi:flagellum-specific ATP synthase